MDGSKYVDARGYVHVRLSKDDPYYPMANRQGYVREHRLVKAKEMGRWLRPEEIIHHKSGNRTCNPPENLECTTAADHRRLHPRPPNRYKFLTQEELKRLFSVITGKRDRAIFLLAYHHGLSVSRIGLMKMEDVDLNKYRIRINRVKHSRGGEHLLEEHDAEALKAWVKQRKDGSPYLFPGRGQKPISRYQLDHLAKVYGRKANIPVDKRHFHVLKHSIATHLLDAGFDLMVVQDWMGHKNIQNTVVYAQITNGARDEVAKRFFASDKIVGT